MLSDSEIARRLDRATQLRDLTLELKDLIKEDFPDAYSLEEIAIVTWYTMDDLLGARACGDLKTYESGTDTMILKEDMLTFLDASYKQLDYYVESSEEERMHMHLLSDEFSVKNNTVH